MSAESRGEEQPSAGLPEQPTGEGADGPSRIARAAASLRAEEPTGERADGPSRIARAAASLRAEEEAQRERLTRRRKLGRFNNALAEHIVSDQQDDESVQHVVGVVINAVWGVLMFLGAHVIRRIVGGQFTIPQLASWLSIAIGAGLLLGRLSRRLREVDSGDPRVKMQDMHAPTITRLTPRGPRLPDEGD